MLKNHTVLDTETSMNATRGTVGKAKLFLNIFVVLLFAIISLPALFDALDSNATEDWVFFGVWYAVMAVFLIVINCGVFTKMVRKQAQKIDSRVTETDYVFEEDYFEATAIVRGEDVQTHTHCAYTSLSSVVEYPDLWSLYYNQGAIYPVRKDGMTEGTAIELTTLLSRKLGAKYTMRKK